MREQVQSRMFRESGVLRSEECNYQIKRSEGEVGGECSKQVLQYFQEVQNRTIQKEDPSKCMRILQR